MVLQLFFHTAAEAPTALVGMPTLPGSVCFSEVTMSERPPEPMRSSERSLSPPWQQENLGKAFQGLEKAQKDQSAF